MTSPDPLEPPTPDGSAAVEPREYGPEEAASVLTPMGQVESLGNFARGLGPRRVRIALFGSLAVLLLVGVLAELR
jgi:hypothetical protein